MEGAGLKEGGGRRSSNSPRARGVRSPTALSMRLVSAAICLLVIGGASADQFHPNKSTTFINKEQLFKVEYLDDASLTGFVAEDVVQLGEYYVSTRFGCVTHSKGHDWAEADGILGMGFPAAALRSVPFPLFWALSDETRINQDQSNVLTNRVFTLMLSEDRGEIVLGGHDPLSVEGAMVTTPVRPSPLADGAEAFMHYMIDVQSLKVGSHELLNFKDSSIAIQAILDSGTSCLVVPDDTFEGGLLASPFKEFQKHFGDLDEPTIYITIEGTTFSIPYDDYMVDDKPCVMKMKNTPRTFLLGDIFFRRMVVVHDLRNPMQPLITVGQRKTDYELTDKVVSLGDRSHMPLGKKLVQRPQPVTEHAVAGGGLAGGLFRGAFGGQPQQQQQQQQQQGGGVINPRIVAYPPGGQVGQGGMQQGGGGGQQPPMQYQKQGGYEEPHQQQYQQPQPQYQPQQWGGYEEPQQQQYQQPPGGYASPQGGQEGFIAPPQQAVPPKGGYLAPQQGYAPPQQAQAAYDAQQRQVQDEPPPLHNPSLPPVRAGPGRRLLGSTDVVQRVPMTTSNSYIYYAQLSVGTPRQKDIHVILDTGSSVFAIFAVPHGGPSWLVIFLLVAACILGATSVGLLILSWYQGQYEDMEEYDPLIAEGAGEGEDLPSKA